jgi:hypothetical protein
VDSWKRGIRNLEEESWKKDTREGCRKREEKRWKLEEEKMEEGI